MNVAELNKVAEAMVAPGRGILAADESTGTIKKRFDTLGVESTADTRRDYREMLFRTKEAMTKYISGVILYDETIRQNAKDGTPLVKLIAQAGALPGIKVDKGIKPLPNCPGEVVTEGLDGLGERLAEYRGLGAKFAKWRAVIDIGEHGLPSYTCVNANAHALARYAALCQSEGIVPIVEPEVLMDGGHDIDRCAEVTTWVLKETFQALFFNRVALEGMVLKPNMAVPGKKSGKRASVEEVAEKTLRVLKETFQALFFNRVALEGMVLKPNMTIPGKKSPKRASVEEVAEKTLRVLKECVPAAVPGIAFLSGGQSDEDATAHLDAMNKMGPLPWHVSFSYGRALQAAPQKTWSGKSENVAAAQRAFSHRAMMNSLAALGQWKADLERKAA